MISVHKSNFNTFEKLHSDSIVRYCELLGRRKFSKIKMDDNIRKLFYIEKSLNNYKYVFHLPKYSDTQRIELSSRIQAVGGVIFY